MSNIFTPQNTIMTGQSSNLTDDGDVDQNPLINALKNINKNTSNNPSNAFNGIGVKPPSNFGDLLS